MVSKETKAASSGHGLLLERVGKGHDSYQQGAYGKGKGKGKTALQSKGQGAADHNQCRLCGQTRHWQRDCWMNKRVQQIAQNASQLGANAGAPALPQSQVANPTAASSRQLPSNAQQDRVKRVICHRTLHQAPHNPQLTHHLRSIAAWFPYFPWMIPWMSGCRNLSLSMRSLNYGESPEWFEEHLNVEEDMIFAVHEGLNPEGCDAPSVSPCHEGVEPVYEVVLDSGADISVMPFDWEALGNEDPHESHLELRDAQGANMPHRGARVLELDVGDDLVIQERFVVTSVGSPLLALGKMFRQGWKS